MGIRSMILLKIFKRKTMYLIHKINSYSYNSSQKNDTGCFWQFSSYLSYLIWYVQLRIVCKSMNVHVVAHVKTTKHFPNVCFAIPNVFILHYNSSIFNPQTSNLTPYSSILNLHSAILSPQTSIINPKP